MARLFLVPVELPGDVSAPLHAVPKRQLDAVAAAAATRLSALEATSGVATSHAARHSVGGADPVTPASIGATTTGRVLALALILGG